MYFTLQSSIESFFFDVLFPSEAECARGEWLEMLVALISVRIIPHVNSMNEESLLLKYAKWLGDIDIRTFIKFPLEYWW